MPATFRLALVDALNRSLQPNSQIERSEGLVAMPASSNRSPHRSPLDKYLAEPSPLRALPDSTFCNNMTTCPICYEANEAPTVKTTCNHIFHRECLLTWLRTLRNGDGTCPSCRAVLYRGVKSELRALYDTANMLSNIIEDQERQVRMQQEGLDRLRARLAEGMPLLEVVQEAQDSMLRELE